MEEVSSVLSRALAVSEDKKEPVPVDIEVDLSLITRETMQEYAEMWAYLILACAKHENVSFVFSPGKKPSEESVTYDEFRDLLEKELPAKALMFHDGVNVEELLKTRVKDTVDESRPNLIRIPIWNKARLEAMRERGEELKKNQYPVALDEVTKTIHGAALRNFEAALAIGLCKAALVIAQRRDAESGKKEELPKLKEEILEKLKGLYKLFIRKEGFTINEGTLSFMISPCSETRIDLAIAHALPPIIRMPINALTEEIKTASLFLQAA